MASDILAVQSVASISSPLLSMPRAPSEVEFPRLDLPDTLGLAYEVNQDTQEVIIKLVDQVTKEVIREIPSEEIQRLHAALRDWVGLGLDRRG